MSFLFLLHPDVITQHTTVPTSQHLQSDANLNQGHAETLSDTWNTVPAEKLGAAWRDFKGEALASIDAVVPLAVAAARHVAGDLGRGRGAGGGCRRHRQEITDCTVEGNNLTTCVEIRARPMWIFGS